MSMRRLIRASFAALATVALLTPAVRAQQAGVHIPTPCEESADSPHGRNEALCNRPANFSLFGIGDNAVAGLRTSVSDATFAVASSTPGDRTVMGNNLPVWLKNLPNIGGRASARFFEYHWYEAASRTDWQNAKANIPSLENVRGGGYMFATNSGQYGGPDIFTGKDGTLGSLFSGVQSAGGSCQDMSGSFLPDGLTLLALSDCPQTWGGNVWKGAPYFSKDSYIAYQQMVGKGNFSFDFWKLPTSLADPDRKFIGTSEQTYAISSDHGREVRRAYGSVIPGGLGDPKWEGYPLGLDYVWDAMTFNVATVGRIQVLQATIINNSKDVYGVGIDYDSLYVGLQTRWLDGDGGGAGRRANVHAIPQLGAVVSNELGRTPTCDGANVASFILGGGCATLHARSTHGFQVGATGLMWLKTPIGDLRNKEFTDPTSPFYNPANPLAGDTITFNRMSLCGFDCANVQFVPQITRQAFGTIAAQEVLALNGRDPNGMTDYDYWALFKPAAGYANRLDPTAPRAGGGFNFCVPGNWHYTNRPSGAPAGPDTLFYDDCDPRSNTQTALWSDTLPDRTVNWAFNNTWSGAGPFPLKAGDTTSVVFAIIMAPDSVQFMQVMQDTYDFYLEHYLGPGSPGVPKITYATADTGIAGLGETAIHLYLDYTPVLTPDASIPNTVNKLKTAVAGTPEYTLVQMNPWLPDSILARAPSVVDSIYVFKSCNGGLSFTATKTHGVCRQDRAIDQSGQAVGTGWQAYAVLTPDAATGQFPGVYSDGFVTGGQSYLYTLVSHRPALVFTVRDSARYPGDTTLRLVLRPDTILPEAYSSLTTNPSAPSVAQIYVPVSSQAASTATSVTATVVGPTPLSYHPASVAAIAQLKTPLHYTVFFGDSVRVVTIDHLARGAKDTTRFVLYRSARVGFASGGSSAVRMQRDSLVFISTNLYGTAQVPAVYGATAASTQSSTVVTGSGSSADTSKVTTSLYTTFTAMVAESTPRTANGSTYFVPFFASAAMGLGQTFQPQTALALPGAPPLIFNVDNRGGVLNQFYWSQPGFTALRAAGWPSVGFLSGASSSTGAEYGEYVVSFRDHDFGPLAPFTISPTNPATTAAQFAQSLAQRVRADSTSVSQQTVDIINSSLGTSYATADLVKLYVPFTIRNAVLDSAGSTNVTLAALRSSVPSRMLLGSGVDTITVPVPLDTSATPATGEWLPGMPLILIENVPVADTANGSVVTQNGQLQMSTVPHVTFRAFTLGCGVGRITCNPVNGLGVDPTAPFVPVNAQQTLHVQYFNPFTAESQVAFTVTPAATGRNIARVGSSDLDAVKVVPNPYIVKSSFEQGGDIRRLLFTHVPPQGVIRIYTAAGVLVQAISWTPDMLNGNGDLFWDMRTREGFDVGPGLYLFTIEATGPNGGAKRHTPGRFIIIR